MLHHVSGNSPLMMFPRNPLTGFSYCSFRCTYRIEGSPYCHRPWLLTIAFIEPRGIRAKLPRQVSPLLMADRPRGLRFVMPLLQVDSPHVSSPVSPSGRLPARSVEQRFNQIFCFFKVTGRWWWGPCFCIRSVGIRLIYGGNTLHYQKNPAIGGHGEKFHNGGAKNMNITTSGIKR